MGEATPEDIVDRLRGKYAVGPMIDGKPEFGYRTFAPLPLIFGEAAAEIEALRTALARVEAQEKCVRALGIVLRDERDAALADCRILLAECEAWRNADAALAMPWEACDERYQPILTTRNAAVDATDASGARTRHAKGGGA